MDPVAIDPMQTGGVLGSIAVVLYTLARLVDHAIIPWMKAKIAQKAIERAEQKQSTSSISSLIRSMNGEQRQPACNFDQEMRDKVKGTYNLLDPKDPRSMYSILAQSLEEERAQTTILHEIKQNIDRRSEARNG